MENQERQPKNRVRMGQNGNEIDIKIIASSEEMADRFYEAIETMLVAMARVDLEKEWKRNQDGE